MSAASAAAVAAPGHGPAGSAPVRILFVLRFNEGGTVTGLLDHVRGLDRSRFEPVVLFYEGNRHCADFASLGARVLVLDAERVRPAPLPTPVGHVSRRLRRNRTAKQLLTVARREWPLARRLARMMKEEGADLVYHNDNSRAHRASILAARMAGLPQICHVRSFTNYFPLIDGPFAAWVDYFIYMSEALRKQCRERLGTVAERGRVIGDPFDLEALAPDTASRGRIRRELGLDPRSPVVVNVGRLVRWKGQHVFIRAMADIVRHRPDARALIVGDADSHPAGREYAEELRQLVDVLGLSRHVTFTGFRRDTAEIMAASDVVVHSSSAPEPFGRVIIEAMAAERPVVATAAGGAVDIVEDGATGLLVPPGDAPRMAAAIARLLTRPREAERMSRRASAMVRSRFALSSQVAAVQQVYEGVLSARPASAEDRARRLRARGTPAGRPWTAHQPEASG